MQKKEEIEEIYTQILKRQFSVFCKQNTHALALIFKALIKGEKQERQELEAKKNSQKEVFKNPLQDLEC